MWRAIGRRESAVVRGGVSSARPVDLRDECGVLETLHCFWRVSTGVLETPVAFRWPDAGWSGSPLKTGASQPRASFSAFWWTSCARQGSSRNHHELLVRDAVAKVKNLGVLKTPTFLDRPFPTRASTKTWPSALRKPAAPVEENAGFQKPRVLRRLSAFPNFRGCLVNDLLAIPVRDWRL